MGKRVSNVLYNCMVECDICLKKCLLKKSVVWINKAKLGKHVCYSFLVKGKVVG